MPANLGNHIKRDFMQDGQQYKEYMCLWLEFTEQEKQMIEPKG